jgi:hypothetical protein
VLALAPDAAAAQAARGLSAPASWSGTGACDEVVWGHCAGSGANPYQVIVDLAAPAYRCTCPSRKFPCKHALALLLRWAAGVVAEASEPADHAAAWLADRAGRAGRTTGKDPGARDDAAAAKRAQERAGRVLAGLDELETWLRDQVRGGLSTAAGRYGHADPVAARMIDAQAPGVAGRLRALGTVPASGDGWPARLLAGYAQLHLLARAYAQLDSLPEALAATVRTHVGHPVRRADVLTEPGVSDDWLVLGVRDVLDATIPTRRTWLRGRESGRYALVLAFAPQGDFGGDPDAAFAPGSVVSATAHFYPGRPPLRVLISARAEARATEAPSIDPGIDAAPAEWAAALELDPWLAEWPAVLRGIPVPGEPAWRLADPSTGAAVPLLTGGVDPWVLAAVSGGRPVTIAGEWTAGGLRPLTVWHGDQAVAR